MRFELRFELLRRTIVGLGVIMIAGAAEPTSAADPDWKAVEQALGKPGQLQANHLNEMSPDWQATVGLTFGFTFSSLFAGWR